MGNYRFIEGTVTSPMGLQQPVFVRQSSRQTKQSVTLR